MGKMNPEDYKKTLLRYSDTYKYDLENINSMFEPERDIIIRAVRNICEYVKTSENIEMKWLIDALEGVWVPAGAKEKLSNFDKHFYAYTTAQLIKRGSSQTQAIAVLKQLYCYEPISFESFYASRIREWKDYEKDISSSMKNDDFSEYANATARLFGSVKCQMLQGDEKAFNKTVDILREWIGRFVEIYKTHLLPLEKGNFDKKTKMMLDSIFTSQKSDLLNYIYLFDDPDTATRVHNCILCLISEHLRKKDLSI